MAIGLVTGLAGIGAAVAAQRRRRRSGGTEALPALGEGRIDEAWIDAELAQTFPASDPLPHPHQVD